MTTLRTVETLGLLVVDDDPHLVASTVRMVAVLCPRWQIRAVPTIRAACSIVREHARTIDVILADFLMPEATGDMLLRVVQVDHPHIIRILWSGQLTIADLAHHRQISDRIVTKPCPVAVIVDEIRQAYAERQPHQAHG